MEETAHDPVAVRYKRGLNLFAPLAVLLGTLVLFGGFIGTMLRSLPSSDRHVAWLLSAVLLAGAAAVAAVCLPPIRRFGGAAPAIVISPEGVRTRDMTALMPWHHIDGLSVHDFVAWAGLYTTAARALEIRPRRPVTGSGGWLWLIDVHAHAFKVSLGVLDKPEMIAEALARHAPPELLERSDLAELPGAEQLPETSREAG